MPKFECHSKSLKCCNHGIDGDQKVIPAAENKITVGRGEGVLLSEILRKFILFS